MHLSHYYFHIGLKRPYSQFFVTRWREKLSILGKKKKKKGCERAGNGEIGAADPQQREQLFDLKKPVENPLVLLVISHSTHFLNLFANFCADSVIPIHQEFDFYVLTNMLDSQDSEICKIAASPYVGLLSLCCFSCKNFTFGRCIEYPKWLVITFWVLE